MNGNQQGTPKNRNVAPPKQINRIAAPIQVTPQNNNQQTGGGQNLQVKQIVQPKQVQRVNVNNAQNRPGVNPQGPQVMNNTQAPMSSVAMAAQNQSIRGANAKKQKKVVKEHDSTTMIFVTILLIILAGLVAFIFYVIMPRIEASKNKVEFNDKTTIVTDPVEMAPSINNISINNGSAITGTGTYIVDQAFTLSTVASGEGIEVSVNGTKVTNTKRIAASVGRVDNYLILILSDGDVRSNRVVIYDNNGTNIKEISRFENAEGMLLFDEDSGYIFSSNMLIIMASRVKRNTIILNDNFGSTDGIDMCDNYALIDNHIDDNFIAIASYVLSYEGNNVFKDPYKINEVTLQEYRDSNKLCR